jgi:type II secretory pathway component GspD/PulD (secretin)
MIIVEAPPARLQEIHERLERFDQPVPQVVLEAIVCVISPESGFRSGLDWGHALTLGDRDLLNLGLAGLTFGGSVTPLGLQNYFNDFAVTSAFVRLLAQEGYLTIRAAPRVMAKDGEKAEISIGRESFFSTQPALNAQFLFRQDIERVEAGIELNITPVIRGDNITVTIEKAEVSEDIRAKDLNPQINNNPFPLINRRRVSTTVNVQDGKTIVIGGLVTRQTVDRVSRVPVLGHCPGIGRMFEIVEKEEKDVEVVIFISPRLVGSGPAVAAGDAVPPAPPAECPEETVEPAAPFQPAAPLLIPAPPPPAEDPTAAAAAFRPVSHDASSAFKKLPPPRVVR